MKANPLDRFMSHVDTSGGPDCCHPWTASRNPKGYGWFRINGRTLLAHRWLLGHLRGGPLPSGEVTRHTCDNPPCCNVRHLTSGSQADNLRDAWSRGRGRNVTAEGNAAMTHCVRGHPFDSKNTYITPDGRRQCRTCRSTTNKRGASVRSPP